MTPRNLTSIRRAPAIVRLTIATVAIAAFIVPASAVAAQEAAPGESTTTTPPPPTTAEPTTIPVVTEAPATTITVPAETTPTEQAPTTSTTTTLPDLSKFALPSANDSRQGYVSNEIDALRATDAEVNARLTQVTTLLLTAQAGLAATTTSAAQASSNYDAAEAALQTAREDAERTKDEVRTMAIDAFTDPPNEAIAAVIMSNGLEDATRRKSMLDLRVKAHHTVLQHRRDAVKQLELDEQRAKEAKDASATAQQEHQAAVDALAAAQAQQASFASALQRRLDNSLSEAGGLGGLDPSVASLLAAQAGSLSAAALAAGIPLGSGPAIGPTTQTPTVQVANVGGITVNVAIAPQIQALLAAFAVTGHKLTGGGYRNPMQQISLRISHCGSDPYSIYQKPSSQCSPPTAPPGKSMHEVGLAIDFQCDGTLIPNHSDFCFQWLTVNASRFGLQNLPSEPWHWSVNGD